MAMIHALEIKDGFCHRMCGHEHLQECGHQSDQNAIQRTVSTTRHAAATGRWHLILA